ncbi:MAG: MBL fold metallo-hydrolase, partial [Clostridia bacterium]|nr:MBL fold metallo-hydrolase [Clostridia bacterium]
MARFCSLFSSSSGNSTFISSASTSILVDAGVSAKRMVKALTDREIDPKTIGGIFITHEHIDHVNAVRILATNNGIPVYATEGTLEALEESGVLNGKFPVNVMPEEGIEVGDLFIKSFKTPHDSRESCGYTITLPDGQKAAIATDIGHMTEEIMQNLKGSALVMLESNHDEGMLRNGPYPYYLKRRILSDVGHLSNNACAEAVTELLKSGTVRFFLGHLSRDNNFPALAYETSASALKTIGAVEGRDFFLEVNKIENDCDIV